LHRALNFPAQTQIQSQAGFYSPAILNEDAAHFRTGPGVVLEAVVLERIRVDDLPEVCRSNPTRQEIVESERIAQFGAVDRRQSRCGIGGGYLKRIARRRTCGI